MPVMLARSLLRFLPEDVAFALTRFLASIPSSAPFRPQDRAILERARRIEFGNRPKRVAWILGEGPLVIFVHGWGGRAGQMATLARHVADQGYQSVVFDGRAHGESAGRRIGFDNFIDDIVDLAAHLGQPLHACVGHSAGALCMMVARRLKGLRAARYVCLCAPFAPYVPIHEIRKRLNPSEAILRRCEAFFAGQFDMSWTQMAQGDAFRGDGRDPLLLVYDFDDERVDHADAERIRALWPSARIVKTTGLGHQKVLREPRVLAEVTDFLGRPASVDRPSPASRNGAAEEAGIPATGTVFD